MITKDIQMKIQHQDIEITLSREQEGCFVKFSIPGLTSPVGEPIKCIEGKVKCDEADFIAIGEAFHEFVDIIHGEGR
jgi:hypothetical protein